MAKLTKASYLFIFIAVLLPLHSLSAHGFFIDLETLGLSSSKDDGSSEAESSPVLVAAPSEMQTTTVEVESKSDPNKSVRLTLEELKSLIMGTVKDVASKASKPQPININISSKSRPKEPVKAVQETTTQPTSYAHNIYKYQTTEKFNYPISSSSWGSESDDDGWSHTPSISYDTNSNEASPPKEDSNVGAGIMSAAKAVFRTPAYIMNSYGKTFNRWRSPKPVQKSKYKPGRRPLPDIVVNHDRRRRRKNKYQRRPQRPQRPQRPGSPRRQRPQRVYYEDEYAEPEYYETRSRYGQESWDRGDFNEYMPSRSSFSSSDDFDSALPDDTPMNMSPPRPYVL